MLQVIKDYFTRVFLIIALIIIISQVIIKPFILNLNPKYNF